MTGKAIVFSAPSGSGKTTIVKELLKEFSNLEFSISATSRAPRGVEKDGVDYYFMSSEEFATRVENGEFIEWEEVYSGTCYGTLRAEIRRIWDKGNIVVFDVDVVGGHNLKKKFGGAALTIFIMPPSVEALRERLIGRGTDSVEAIEKRVSKAVVEIENSKGFDAVVVNDVLEVAVAQTKSIIKKFLNE